MSGSYLKLVARAVEPRLRWFVRRVRRLGRQLAGREVWASRDLNIPYLQLGSDYGEHCVAPKGLSTDSIVYSLGVGRDVSFDLELINEFGCTVFAFDPTPESVAWVSRQDLPQEFIFSAVGVAHFDGDATFSPPENEQHVSHSMVAILEDRQTLTLPVRRVSSLMAERDHLHIDVLKMDVEGSEYGIIDDILGEGLEVYQILLEYHPGAIEDGVARTARSIDALRKAGYRVFRISPDGREYSLIRL